MRLPKDLVAASAKPLLLALLKQGDSYGYEIIKNAKEISGGRLEWKEGMLYPLLHRLEAGGLIESYERSSESGRPRKYYRLRPEGADELEAQQESFAAIFGIMKSFDGFNLAGNQIAGAARV